MRTGRFPWWWADDDDGGSGGGDGGSGGGDGRTAARELEVVALVVVVFGSFDVDWWGFWQNRLRWLRVAFSIRQWHRPLRRSAHAMARRTRNTHGTCESC